MGAAWKLLGSCKAAVTGNGTPVLQELQRRVSWDDEIPNLRPKQQHHAHIVCSPWLDVDRSVKSAASQERKNVHCFAFALFIHHDLDFLGRKA